MAKVTGTSNPGALRRRRERLCGRTGIAVGVLCYDVPDSASTQKVVIIARSAIVKSDLLVWEASNDNTEK